jgi:hypothetical protein
VPTESSHEPPLALLLLVLLLAVVLLLPVLLELDDPPPCPELFPLSMLMRQPEAIDPARSKKVVLLISTSTSQAQDPTSSIHITCGATRRDGFLL